MNKIIRTVKKSIAVFLLCLYSLFLTPMASAGWFDDLLNCIYPSGPGEVPQPPKKSSSGPRGGDETPPREDNPHGPSGGTESPPPEKQNG